MSYIDSNNIEFSDDRTALISCPTSYDGELVVPGTVDTIRSGAFKDCKQLKSLVLPRSLVSVESGAFTDSCTSLHDIQYQGTLKEWLALNWNAVLNCWHRLHIDGTVLTDVVIPDGITTVRNLAFYYSTVKKVVFGSDVIKLGDSCFNKTDLAGDLVIPEGVVHLGNNCFLSCQKLTSITIPASVSHIGSNAFRFGKLLKAINVAPENPFFSSDEGIIYDKSKTKLGKVPDGTQLTSYTFPETLTDIAPYAISDTQSSCVFSLNNDVTYKIGNNAFKDSPNIRFAVKSGTKQRFIDMGFPAEQIIEQVDDAELSKVPVQKIGILANNPFRILGCLSNASQREVSANTTKIQRFASVGKEVQFPVDFSSFFPKPERNEESVKKASNAIYLPKEKIKYALFWLSNASNLDEVSIAQANAGNIDKALSILRKGKEWSNLQNTATLSLIKGSIVDSISAMLGLIHSDQFSTFISCVAGETAVLSQEEVAKVYLDEVRKFVEPFALCKLVASLGQRQDADYLMAKLIGEPIAELNALIDVAKDADVHDPEESYNAGVTLMNSSKSIVAKLTEFRELEKIRVENAIDNLAKQILQCGINYYNSSDEYEAASKAMVLQKYAEDLAIGKLVKDRCKQNTDILRKIISNLPPKEIYYESQELQEIFAEEDEKTKSCKQVIEVIKKCAPTIISARGKLGKESASYKELCSDVANYAIGKVIDIVNTAMKNLENATKGSSSFGMYGLYLPSSQATIAAKRAAAMTAIKEADQAMQYIAKLDTTTDFKKNRYDPNSKTLKSLANSAQLSLYPITVDLDLRTEDEHFDACSSVDDYNAYLTKYPNGKHRDEASERITAIKKRNRRTTFIVLSIIAIISVIVYFYAKGEQAKAEERAYQTVLSENTASACELYIRQNPNGAHKDEVMDRLLGIASHGGIFELEDFSKKYPQSTQSEKAVALVNHVADSLYTIAKKKNTIDAWNTFKASVPSSCVKDADSQIHNICVALYNKADKTHTVAAWNNYKKAVPASEYRDADSKIAAIQKEIEENKWKTESTAWQAASAGNTIALYEKYLQNFPYGSHAAAARKRIIDIRVNNIAHGDHGTLPSMDQSYYGYGSTSSISVSNDTSYQLTLLYSGSAESKEIIIPAHGSRTFTLRNGTYRIAASVKAANVRSYYGTETLSGGGYSASYYISTTRY